MRTKWGPSTSEMGTQKAYISKLTETSKFIEEASFFLNKKYSQRQSVSSFSAQCLCHLHWIIKWSTLDGGCTEFSRVLKPELEKMGTLKKNGDPMGTQNLKKVPMGTRVPKWGPMWEQCHCGWFIIFFTEYKPWVASPLHYRLELLLTGWCWLHCLNLENHTPVG